MEAVVATFVIHEGRRQGNRTWAGPGSARSKTSNFRKWLPAPQQKTSCTQKMTM